MSYGSGDISKGGGSFTGNTSVGYDSYQNYGNEVPSTDFQKLTDAISSNVDKISQSVQEIKRLIKQLGTNRDTADLREQLHHRQHHTNQLCKDTAKYLKDVRSLPAAAMVSEQRHRKTQTKLLTDNFSDVLNSFQAAQREAASTEKECVAKARVASAALREGEVLVDLEGDVQDQQQSQITADELREIEERETAIRDLEADIVDVNMIFKDLATMVYEQGEVVDSIEGNIEHGEDNIVQGNQQLLQARASKASLRKKKCICAVIVAVIVVIIIIIIAVEVPKKH